MQVSLLQAQLRQIGNKDATDDLAGLANVKTQQYVN